MIVSKQQMLDFIKGNPGCGNLVISRHFHLSQTQTKERLKVLRRDKLIESHGNSRNRGHFLTPKGVKLCEDLNSKVNEGRVLANWYKNNTIMELGGMDVAVLYDDKGNPIALEYINGRIEIMGEDDQGVYSTIHKAGVNDEQAFKDAENYDILHPIACPRDELLDRILNAASDAARELSPVIQEKMVNRVRGLAEELRIMLVVAGIDPGGTADDIILKVVKGEIPTERKLEPSVHDLIAQDSVGMREGITPMDIYNCD